MIIPSLFLIFLATSYSTIDAHKKSEAPSSDVKAIQEQATKNRKKVEHFEKKQLRKKQLEEETARKEYLKHSKIARQHRLKKIAKVPPSRKAELKKEREIRKRLANEKKLQEKEMQKKSAAARKKAEKDVKKERMRLQKLEARRLAKAQKAQQLMRKAETMTQ